MQNDFFISIPHFEGSILRLTQHIKKEEIDVLEIELSKLASHCLEHFDTIDIGSELILTLSSLLLWKSKKLLPVVKNDDEPLDENDYFFNSEELSKYREIAVDFIELEKQQFPFIPRDVHFQSENKGLGLEEVKLEDLAALFQKILERQTPKTIIEFSEEFDLSVKVKWLQEEMIKFEEIPFESLFSLEKSKIELIILFLALLELVKLQEIAIVKDRESFICKKKSIS